MELGIGSILAGLWTVIGVPLVVRGFQWLGSTINRNKTFESSMVDDEIMRALRIAVSNLGNKTADTLRKNPKNWKRDIKDGLREAAKDEALLLLDNKSRKRFHDIGDAGLDMLIRKIVDDRNGA